MKAESIPASHLKLGAVCSQINFFNWIQFEQMPGKSYYRLAASKDCESLECCYKQKFKGLKSHF